MNRSKISRSIVVVIFVVVVIFFSYIDVSLIFDKSDSANSTISGFIKVGYVFSILALVLLYLYIKDKLYKMKIKRKISFIYRYMYIIVALVITRGIAAKSILNLFSKSENIIYFIACVLTGIIIKRIIFNISKSDTLSVLVMFSYALFPAIVQPKVEIIHSTFIMFFFFLAVLLLQFLIDELKQRGVRTKKYLWLSLLLGMFAGISITLGIPFYVWGITIISLLLTTVQLDNTHISFPKVLMSSLTQEGRENLYKIERININKVYISIIVILVTIGITVLPTNYIFKKAWIGTQEIQQIVTISEQVPVISLAEINFEQTTINAKALLGYAKMFYLILFVYILLMEALTIILRRRYDTKTTSIKVLFITLVSMIITQNLNTLLYGPIVTMLMVIIAIINTSNIYLNREERVKMLVA